MTLRLRVYLIAVGVLAVVLLGLDLPADLPERWGHYAAWAVGRGWSVTPTRKHGRCARCLPSMVRSCGKRSCRATARLRLAHQLLGLIALWWAMA